MNLAYYFKKYSAIIYLIFLVSLSSFLFFYKLGHSSLWDPDEPRYAEAGKQMVKSGDWLVPRFNGKERFDKPVLFYWLIALAYKIFGVNEFAARFWSAFFGLSGVVLVFFLGKKMFSTRAGFLAGLILATNIQYIALSRLAITDMSLTFFLELAFFSFWFGYQSSNNFKKNLFYLIFYASIALAALTKGPVALIFSGFIILLFLILTKDLKALKEMRLFWGIFIFMAVAFPWYIAIIHKYGWGYINYFFLKHNLARFATPDLRHPGPLVYYVPVLLIGLFPWSAFLASSLWYLAAGIFKNLLEQKKQIIFLLLWFGSIFLFFSISQAKLPTYIMPLYFPLALLLGKFLEIVIEKKEEKSTRRHINISSALLGLLILSLVVALFIFLKINCPNSYPVALIINICFLLGGIVSLFLLKKKRFLTAFVSLGLVMAIFNILVLELVIPSAEKARSLKEASQRIVSLGQKQYTVVSYRFLKPSTVFYCDQNIRRLESKEELVEFLNYPTRIFCWIDTDDEYYEEVKDLIKTKSWIVAQTPTKMVISNQP